MQIYIVDICDFDNISNILYVIQL